MAQSMRRTEIYPITVRELEVLRVRDVTPGMRRVTLGGEGLRAHAAPNGMPVNAFRSDGFDDEFKIFLTHPSLTEPLVPEQADGTVVWPRDERLVPRTYTVRRWDPDAGEVDVDFVVHGVGMATTWARRVVPGERIPVAGPKSSGSHPAGADWTLVAGDETALPAIARWLEEWPAGARGKVFIEVGSTSHRQELTVPEGVELTWLSRHGAEPGTTTVLQDALTSTEWWPGTPFAWVAGEATTLTPIRRWLRNEMGLGREQIEVTGYWKRQPTAVSAADPQLPGAEPGHALHERLEALTGVLPAFAVRTAVTLGIPGALADGPRTAAELASTLGTPVDGLERLLPYLVVHDVLDAHGTPAAYGLRELGRELLDEHLGEDLDLDGAEAWEEIMAGFCLLAAVRGGDGARSARARTRADRASRPGLVAAQQEEAEEFADCYGPTLAGMLPLAQCRTVAVAGPAAGGLAELFAREQPELRVTVLAEPAELEVLRRRHTAHPRIAHLPLPDDEERSSRHDHGRHGNHPRSGGRDADAEFDVVPGGLAAERGPGGDRDDHDAPREPFDAVVLAMELTRRTDERAQRLLEALRPVAGLYVMDEMLDPVGAEEHDVAHGVVDFALTGGGARTDERFRALLAASGYEVASRRNVGWSGQLYTAHAAEGRGRTV